MTPKNVCENVWICYTVMFVNFLHVWGTFCGHFQEAVFKKDILQIEPRQCQNVKC